MKWKQTAKNHLMEGLFFSQWYCTWRLHRNKTFCIIISGCLLGKAFCHPWSNQNNYGHKLHMQNWDPVGVLIHSACTPGNCWFLTMGLSADKSVPWLLAFSLLYCSSFKQQRDLKKNKNLTIAEEEKSGVKRVTLEPPSSSFIAFTTHLCKSGFASYYYSRVFTTNL